MDETGICVMANIVKSYRLLCFSGDQNLGGKLCESEFRALACVSKHDVEMREEAGGADKPNDVPSY